MLTVLLGLGSAAMYGLSDFLGGLLGRRTSVWAVATVTQVTAGIAIGIATLAMAGNPSGADLAWGSLAGIGTGTGTAFLYRGLAAGRMGVVAPLSAVGAALLPVAVGVAIGERPAVIVWLGIGLALPAIWLITTSADPIHVTGRRQRLGAGVADGLLAGLGFGLMFAALGQVPERAGLAPLAAAEGVSIVVVITLAVLMGQRWLPRDRASLGGVAVGALAAAAAVLFLLATQAGLLSVASVLSSLYPGFAVLLAAAVLREHVSRSQALGLALAIAAVGMVAAG